MKLSRWAPAFVAVGFVAVWWSIAWMPGTNVPSPADVLHESLPKLALMIGEEPSLVAGSRALAIHLKWSAARTFAGLGLGIATAALIFAFAGCFRIARSAGLDASEFAPLKNLPLFALIPLFTYWFSSTETAFVSYVALAVCVILVPAVIDAVARVPQQHIDLYRLIGGRPSGAFANAIVPQAVADLRYVLRWVIGLSWAFGLGAEYVGSPERGLGVIVYQAYVWADTGRLVLIALVYTALGCSSIWLFDQLFETGVRIPHFTIRKEET